MRIGIFGGTFDPIHMGHLVVTEEARVLLGLNEVLFIPAGRPWFKAHQDVTDGCHRIAMVELAIGSNPCFKSVDIEVIRPGATYTVDTIVELQQRLGDEVEFYLILGVDSLHEIHRWREVERLFDMATIVGMSRPDSPEFDPKTLDGIAPNASAKVTMLKGPMIDISGTDIRRRVAEGRSIKYRVPEAVESYIYEHGLYR